MPYPTYTPTDWVDGVTPTNAVNLDHIELGIKDVNDAVQDLDQRFSSSGSNITGEYTFNATPTAPPGAGQVRLDNVDQTAATKAFIHGTDAPGVDMKNAFMQTKAGHQLYIQDKDDSTRWRHYNITADAIDQGTYIELNVAYIEGGLDVPEQRSMVVVQRGGGGGGGGGGAGIEYENVWNVSAEYQAGDVVKHNGVEYLAVNPSTGQTPPAYQVPAVAVPIPLVTALPASPFDGQEVILVDSLTLPTYIWRFCYVASITDAHKWVFVGGSPFVDEQAATVSTGGTTYVDLAGGPQFTIPRSGLWELAYGAFFSNSANFNFCVMSPKLGAAATADLDKVQGGTPATNEARSTGARTIRRTLAAADLVKMQYKREGGAGNSEFTNRWLNVRPVRVA